MSRARSGFALVAALLGTAAAFAQPASGVARVADKKLEDTPRLTVRGDAELKKPADEIYLRIGVVTENTDAGEALDANTERMNAVVKVLERAGLTKDEYKTGRFQIRPKYTRRPRQVDADWTPKIVGYSVTNSISIETKKIDQAGRYIAEANRAGANSADVAGFGLAEPRMYRAEAIRKATENALRDAREMAEAAGLRLVRIININLDSAATPRGPEASPMMMSRARGADSGAPPIEAGDVTIRAAVSVSYEIAPQ